MNMNYANRHLSVTNKKTGYFFLFIKFIASPTSILSAIVGFLVIISLAFLSKNFELRLLLKSPSVIIPIIF